MSTKINSKPKKSRDKVMDRKMKNRESAKNSYLKKKAHMASMEEKVEVSCHDCVDKR